MPTILSQVSLVEKREEIDSLLISIIGEQNFKKHVTFNQSRSKADRFGNQHGSFKSFENAMVNFIPQMYDLWYDLDLVKGDFLNDVIFVRIIDNDSALYISIDGIPNSFKNKRDCKLINESNARAIARKNGLAKGINTWEAKCYWKKDGGEWLRKDSISISVSSGYYYWAISSDVELISTTPCKIGDFESIRINAETGKFIDKRKGHYDPCSF